MTNEILTNEIFISLTKDDKRIAKAFASSIKEFFGEKVNVNYSYSYERRPEAGRDWFEWILEQVQNCDFALVLVTKASVEKSWILWESGLIYGVGMGTGKKGVLIPIVYELTNQEVPTQFSRTEYRFGEEDNDVRSLFSQILKKYKGILGSEELSNKMTKTVESHMQQVRYALRLKPLIKMVNDEYLTINISDDWERTKKKNEVAKKLGECVRKNGISRPKLSCEDDQFLLLALAQVVHDNPEENDVKLLVNTKGKVKWKHIRFMILYSIELLNHKGYIKKEDVPDIEEMLADFNEGEKDDNLEWRIKATERIINLIKLS